MSRPNPKPAAEAEQPKRPSLLAKIAARYNVDPDKMLHTLKATVFRGIKQKDGSFREATNEELMALLVVADQYRLNPFTREIYAFPDEKRGGIVPVVSIDGWLRIINEQPSLTSIDIRYGDFDLPKDDPACDPYIEVTISRSDRTAPIVVREYMRECYRDTGPWNSHPRRMLRWKAIIQASRVAFGFGGIFDPDEADRIANAIDVTPAPQTMKPKTAPPRAIEAQRNELNDLQISDARAQPPEAVPAEQQQFDDEVPYETEAGVRG